MHTLFFQKGGRLMSFAEQNPYQSSAAFGNFAAAAGESERTAFIRRTYAHLAGAVFAFIAIEMVIFTMVPPQTLASVTKWMLGGWNWLLVLGGFMVVSFVADRWARSAVSPGMQYAGLGLYVVCEAIIFVPILLLAQSYGQQQGQNIIASAGLMTAVVFGGLTVLVFVTRADFSWLGRYLGLAAMAALGFIFCAVLFDMQIGDWFAALMVVLAAGYILYYTSNILYHYRLDQHVAAALALFASVALLFWYILQLFMGRD
jgi:hypothetical protein